MNSNEKRTGKYKKNKVQESVLQLMNETLYPKESELIKEFDKPKLPIIFIVGAQRSGTTLLMQLITQLFEVSYPNNFIARYWNVPYIGAILFQNIFPDADTNNFDFSSDLGYTKGVNGPHEFGYFWKKWFPWEGREEKKYNEIDYSILQKQIAAWESVNKKPLVFKNIIDVSFNIDKLNNLFPNAFFIHIKRKPEYVVQSSYQSRIKLYGNPNEWLGLKPPEYNKIKNINNIFEQITAQVYYSQIFIDNNLQNNNIKSITINYEDLVNNAKEILSLIKQKTGIKQKTNKIPILKNTNKQKLTDKEFIGIQKFIKEYFK